jgi:putative Holliday junction resolvase
MIFPTSGKLLGVDHGLQRIGLATSDALQVIARELTILQRKSKAEDFARIQNIVAHERIVGIVLGIPYNDSIDEGVHQQADTVRTWAARLAEAISLPILLWDEQYSSADAVELSRQKRRKPRDPIDDLAARVVLQRYLDALRDGLVNTTTHLFANDLRAGRSDLQNSDSNSDMLDTR